MSETPALIATLIENHVAISETHARDTLKSLADAGFEIRTVDVLDDTQRARVEALRVAKSVLSRPTGAGGLIPVTAVPASEIDNLVPLARFVLTGSEYEEDVRVAAAEDRAAREASDGHVCQPIPTPEPDRLAKLPFDVGGPLPTGTVTVSDG